MSRSWWLKASLILIFALLAAVVLTPTVLEMVLYPEVVDAKAKELAAEDEESVRNPPLPDWYEAVPDFLKANTLSLGLDLQGGLLLRYSVDIDSAIDDKMSRFGASIRSTIIEQKGTPVQFKLDRDQNLLSFDFDKAEDTEIFDNQFMLDYQMLTVVARSGNSVTLGLRDDFLKDTEESSVKQAVEIIRERIDGLGVAQPSVRVESGRNIVVELPGLSSKRAAAAEKLISTTAVLTFKLAADKNEALNLFTTLSQNIPADSKIYASAGTLQASDMLDNEGRMIKSGKEQLKEFIIANESLIPSGREIAYEKISLRELQYDDDAVKQVQSGKIANIWRIRLVRTDLPSLTGDNVDTAYPASNPDTNMPYVALKLDKRGGDVFYDLTKAHVGEQLAILMDDTLVSDPVIRTEIPGGNVSIEMGSGNRQETLEEVNNLVVSLRSGALPAPIRQEFKTLVGPTLGMDSIVQGSKALALGFALVVLFMIFYYKFAGLLACLSLSLNVLFILAIMASMGAVLTMPGIAGIVLTVGMAVDANVIIFERIREELRARETYRKSVQIGYEKALWTILDSNITTAIAAIVLMQLGSGPVRGFAVTLLIGLVCSVYTAFYVTRSAFELKVRREDSKFSI
ncbi:MAG: protein translocase subunit SecD [Bradymonadales bacterium]|jgi:preprotein translocase subunit SecD